MNIRLTFVLLALAVLVAGCQSTQIRSAWFDTDFTGPPLRKIVVVGIIDNVAEGRVFEDIFVEKLRAAGVDAIAGYTIMSNEARAVESSFVAAVTNSGAQGLLLVRLLGVDTRSQVTTTMVPAGMGWGRGGWGTTGTVMVPVQQVSQYELATVESKLFAVQTKQLIWASTTTTFNPRSVARETPAFADLVIAELAGRNVIQRK